MLMFIAQLFSLLAFLKLKIIGLPLEVRGLLSFVLCPDDRETGIKGQLVELSFNVYSSDIDVVGKYPLLNEVKVATTKTTDKSPTPKAHSFFIPL